MVTAGPEPPRGHVLEHVLGSVHRFPEVDAQRLTYAEGRFQTGGEQGALAEGAFDLGYLDRRPLPLLVGLEERRLPETGQVTLVAGPDDAPRRPVRAPRDPRLDRALPDPPRAADVLRRGRWSVVGLHREVDRRAWRHRYRVEPLGEAVDAVALGSLGRHPAAGTVALARLPDGRLASDLCAPGGPAATPARSGAGWASRSVPMAPRGRGCAAAPRRLRHLNRGLAERRSAGKSEVLGYLPRQLAPGCRTLYSTVHSVTGDQLVTVSRLRLRRQGT